MLFVVAARPSAVAELFAAGLVLLALLFEARALFGGEDGEHLAADGLAGLPQLVVELAGARLLFGGESAALPPGLEQLPEFFALRPRALALALADGAELLALRVGQVEPAQAPQGAQTPAHARAVRSSHATALRGLFGAVLRLLLSREGRGGESAGERERQCDAGQ